MIERFNRSVKMAVYKYMTQWRTQYIDEVTLQKIVSNYNNCIHGTTKQVPNSLHEEQDAEMIAAARGELKYRAKKLVAANQHNLPQLREGDTVRVARVTSGEWCKTRQLKTYSYLSQWFVELYKVSEITKGSSTKSPMYKLLDPDSKIIDRYFLRQDLLKVDKSKLVRELDKGTYVVESVLDGPKVIRGVKKYLVSWVGYDVMSWQRPEPGFQKLIDTYEKAKAAKARMPKVDNLPVQIPVVLLPKTPQSVLPCKEYCSTGTQDTCAKKTYEVNAREAS